MKDGGSSARMTPRLADSIYLGQSGVVRRTQQLVVQGTIEDDTTQVKWALQKEGTKR